MDAFPVMKAVSIYFTKETYNFVLVSSYTL